MLKLKKEDYEKILDHCRKGLPNESCGLLGGTIEDDVKTIEKVYLLTDARKRMADLGMSAPKESYRKVKVMGKEFDPAKPDAYINSFAIKRS